MERQFFPGECIRCLCNYEDACEGELPYSEGEILQIVAIELDSNWLIARNASGEEGSVSVHFVQKYEYVQKNYDYTQKAIKSLTTATHLTSRISSATENESAIASPQPNYTRDQRRPSAQCISQRTTTVHQHKASTQTKYDSYENRGGSMNYLTVMENENEYVLSELYEVVPQMSLSSPETQHDQDEDSSKLQEGSQRGEVWTPGQKVECLSNYDGLYSVDLSFSKGDILTIVSVTSDKNVYYAKDINGREGVVGKNFVQKYDEPSMDISGCATMIQTNNIIAAQAFKIFNFANISLDSDIRPLRKYSAKYWTFFANTFYHLFQEIWTPGQLVECMFNSDGLHEGDFSISKGEILMIVRATKDKKWYVAKNVQGREGFIRANCVRKHLDLLANQASIYALDGYSSIRKPLMEIRDHAKMIQDEQCYFTTNVTEGKSLIPGEYVEISEDLEAYRWFHGKINREVCENLLQPRQDGLYLVRYSSLATAVYALSVCCTGNIYHIPILNDRNRLTIDGRCNFEKLAELVEHYTKHADGLPTRLIHACAKAGGQVSESCVADLRERFTAVLNKAKRKIYRGNVLETALALFRYAASNSDELNLTEGNVINVHNKELEEYGWWIGEHHGHIGAFPCTHVKVIKEVVYAPRERVKCLVKFCGTSNEFLPFSRQEILTIISRRKDEPWYLAKNVTGRNGLIPAHYVDKYEVCEAYTWFHGKINSEVCENLLQPREDGLFLVRYSPLSVADYVLSICCEERLFHFLIRNDRYGMNIDGGRSFDTLAELVEHYTKDADGLPTRLIRACTKAGRLPLEILCMDENSQKLYREALAAGKEKVYNIRVMIVGHHGVGKTALTKRLLEEDINEEDRVPTEGIEVHARCCQIDHDSGEWKTMETEVHQHDQRILRIVQKHLNLKESRERSDTSTKTMPEYQTIDKTSTNMQDNYLEVKATIPNTEESETDGVTNISLDTQTRPSSSKQSKILPSPAASDVMNPDTGIYMSLYTKIHSASSEEISKLDSEYCDLNVGSVKNEQGKVSPSRGEYYTMIDLDTAKNSVMNEQGKVSRSHADYYTVIDLDTANNTTEERSLTFSGSTRSDVTMLDFAGHFMFYTTHQAFMSWRTQYILVTDITMSLKDGVQDDKCDMDMSGDRTCSPLEYILYWLNAIHSHAGLPSEYQLSTNNNDRNPGGKSKSQQDTASESPPVILVATHADKIPKDQVQMKKKTYFENVRGALRDRPLRFHLIDEDFAITNIKSDPGIDALKSKIFEIAKRQDYWGEEVPARWLLLEQVLMELKRQGVVIIDYTEVENRNQSLQVKIESSEELQLFLRFENDLGNIVYLSTKKLRGKIVLHPEWLINGLKVLIASEQIVKLYPGLSKDWYNFKDTGRLAKNLLDGMWSQHSDYHEHQQHLLDLMEQLNIIAKPHRTEEEEEEDDCYWVPCMVHKTAPEDVKALGERQDVTKTSTLCFKSKTKFIHVGVFHRLLASCLSRWSPAKEGERYLLFSGFCVFELDDCHNLMLSLNDYVINVTMVRFSNKVYPEISLCIATRDYLQTTLSEIASCLCPNSEFEVCIKCNKSAPQSNEGFHKISSLRKNEQLRCNGHREIHTVESNELLRFWEANDSKIPKNVLTAQSALATDRFMRIYSVLVDLGTKILRRLLHYYTVTPHRSLDQYLQNNRPIILDLKKKKVLNPSQINIIFPQAGDTDIRRYDITLLSALLNNIVPALGQIEKQSVVDLRNHRNTIMHAKSTKMGINDFQSMWMRITTTLTHLSKLCGDTTFEEEIKTEIQDIQKSASSDILSRMDSFEEELKKIGSDVAEIKKHSVPADQSL